MKALEETENYGVAHIYFEYNEQERQKPITILSSLVKQIASRIPHLPEGLADLYDKLRSKNQRPSFEELYATLLDVSKCGLIERVFLVFDALDECDLKTQRRELLQLFQRMGANGFSVFLTSRPHPEDILDSLVGAAQIVLSAQAEDIATYVKDRINRNPRARRLVQKSKCLDRIVSELTKYAKGM